LNTRIRGPQQRDEVLDGTSDGGDRDQVRICTHANNNKECAHALSQNLSKNMQCGTPQCAQ
jgi:hypothetical protein